VEGSQIAATEPVRVLVPQARRVGPGRIELGYQRRIEELARAATEEGALRRAAERELDSAQGRLQGAERALDTAARLERGLQRLADRLEDRLETAAQREKRLILALGSLQKENELLRERLALGSGAGKAALPPAARSVEEQAAQRGPPAGKRPVRKGFWARLSGR